MLSLFVMFVVSCYLIWFDVQTPMSETTNNDMAKAPWWFI